MYDICYIVIGKAVYNMEKETTSNRLRKIMSERNLRQVDILNLAVPYCEKYNVKLNKSDLSQYCSGKTEPNQDKLFILGEALNVNEAWLMGYDVPMARIAFKDIPQNFHSSFDNIEEFKAAYDKSKLRGDKLLNAIIENIEHLNNDNRKRLFEYSQNLLTNQQMEEELMPNAAHESRKPYTAEERQADEDMLD